MSKKLRRLDRIEANTKRIESTGFELRWFSYIHVRVDNRVDFWTSTGNWHIKGRKKEGKTFEEMVSYLKGEGMEDKEMIKVESILNENKRLKEENKELHEIAEYARFFMLNDFDRFDKFHIDAKEFILEYRAKTILDRR